DYGAKHKTITGTDNALTNPEGVKEEIPVYVHGNVGMSEYGADCSPFIHEEEPGYWAGSQSEEFTSQWHEIYYKAISESDWMWGSYIWNMFEFGSDGRTTTPDRLGINTKGVVAYDRALKKDCFYFYKANWSDTPTLHINSSRFEVRNQNQIDVKVYSNMETVELFMDGVSLGKLTKNGNSEPALNTSGQPDDTLVPNTQLGKFEWLDVDISEQGEHTAVAVGTDSEGNVYTDTVVWTREYYSEPGISSSRYSINEADPENRTIAGVPGDTTVAALRAGLTPLRNSTIAFYTADDQLIEDEEGTRAVLGTKVKVTAEDGVNVAWYTIVASPVSQGKATGAGHTQTTQDVPTKNVVDGNPNTRWGSGGSYPEWFIIDLGQPYTITEFNSLWYDSANRTYEYEVYGSLTGSVSSSDGDYTLLCPEQSSVQGQDGNIAWTKQVLDEPVIARYIKLNITGHTGSPSIYEFQVNGFALTSKEYAIDNGERTIAGVDEDTTVEELLAALTVDGIYDSVTVVKDGAPVTEGTVTPDMTVVVAFNGSEQAVYTLVSHGPSTIPVSQGKTATAQNITVGDKEIPNEDSGEGCANSGQHHDVAANINDGNLSTRWTGALTESGHTIPDTAYPADVLIDLGAEYELYDLYLNAYDPSTRIYQFVVYAGNTDDVAALKSDENILLDMRDNTDFGEGNKSVTGSARYILLSVTGNTAPSAYRAASIYELAVYGYRIASEVYGVDLESKTISNVPEQVKVSDFLEDLKVEGNYTAKLLLDGEELPSDGQVTPGVELEISGLNGEAPQTYTIEFIDPAEAIQIPVSQGMEVYAHDVETDHGTVPNEDISSGHNDGAVNINDGNDETRWTGAFDSAHGSCYYPAAVTISMTDPKSTDDYYYLTGVKIHFYDKGDGSRSYGYNI
ncbi:discoidin domain-containing protein, partial [Flavonifractor hominis]